jgi:dipeptidyl aminopeptidase/acylaminoacyl peptidase
VNVIRMWPSAVLLWLLLFAASAPARAAETLAADLREEVQRVAVRVKDGDGREQARQIPITFYRPRGPGPFPLVILNHGRPKQALRASMERQRFEGMARYLVGRGFAVFVPTRVGYGENYG